jgi:hypothetical protein
MTAEKMKISIELLAFYAFLVDLILVNVKIDDIYNHFVDECVALSRQCYVSVLLLCMGK